MVLVGLSGCRRTEDRVHVLPTTYQLEIEGGDLEVEVEVNGKEIRTVPWARDGQRRPLRMMSESVDLTPWLEPGANQVVLDASWSEGGSDMKWHATLTQHRRYDGSHASLYDREFDGAGRLEITVTTADTECPALTDEERDAAIAAAEGVRDAHVALDQEAYARFLPEEGMLRETAEYRMKEMWPEWDPSVKATVDFTPDSVRVVKSCANDAVFVTPAGGGMLFVVESVDEEGRSQGSMPTESLAFRKTKDGWRLIE